MQTSHCLLGLVFSFCLSFGLTVFLSLYLSVLVHPSSSLVHLGSSQFIVIRLEASGRDWIVIIGHRSSKGAFGAKSTILMIAFEMRNKKTTQAGAQSCHKKWR